MQPTIAITIARDLGIGGSYIGQQAAKELSYAYGFLAFQV